MIELYPIKLVYMKYNIYITYSVFYNSQTSVIEVIEDNLNKKKQKQILNSDCAQLSELNMFIGLRGSDLPKNISKGFKTEICAYEKLEVLGKGTYGIVYKAKNKQTQEMFAIKKIQKKIVAEEGISRLFHRQIAILRSLDHPSIIKLVEYNLTESQKYGFLVFEFMESDLAKEISKDICEEAKIGKYSCKNLDFKETIRNIFRQLLEGIKYSHSKRIFHRDLKPSNIVVDGDLHTIKIADFGVAKQFSIFGRQNTAKIGTKYYRAPETMLNKKNYGPEIDIWGIALIISECIIGEPLLKLFQNQANSSLSILLQMLQITQFPVPEDQTKIFDELLAYIDKNQIGMRIHQRFPIFNILGENGVKLLNDMLQIHPQRRIKAHQALMNPYFSQIFSQNMQKEIRQQI